ncbi:MAG: nitrous oxide-stimulated promoter family protein [Dehalococcoidales bacterium]|nr:nitrous oxide-stimulated promoter family protein [Dehalococcoidales bacterium]
MTRIERERRTVDAMISLYCRRNHRSNELCSEYRDSREYAFARLEKCPFGEDKPACTKCPVHCYKPEMREKIRQVMRYSGPQMLLKHPVMTVFHLLNGRKKTKEKQL